MTRTLPPLQLRKSPLVLVLCQVRIAAIRNIAKYIPEIQDQLRREDFPVDVSGEVRELVAVQGEGSARERRRMHWEFRTLEEEWSIIVGESAVVLQTTTYSNFDEFLRTLSLAMDVTNKVVGNLVVERIGFRYIDVIKPRPDESWKDYVQPGYHGQENEIIRPDHSVLFIQTKANTGPGQRMIGRLTQNRDGMLLPQDLVPHHPVLQIQAEPEQLLTLLDFDHYRKERQPFEDEKLTNIAWELHDTLDMLFRDMVTKHALEAWR